jgi:hypothetical protein
MDDIGDLNTELEPWQVEEIDKCRESFEYFASNYVHITHPKRGLVKFNMYDYQKRMVADYEKYTYNIISKFRQGGATTTTVLWCMWRCLFMCDQKILVVSIGDREAVGAGKTVKVALENLPDWMKPQMGKNNDHEKEFHDTNSSIIFASPKAVRSMSLTLLVIDEAAFISNMDDLWAAMMPTLSTGGSCVVISTVNGIGNWYEEMYHGAVEGKNEFHCIDIDYTEHPDYCHPDFAKRMRANLGERKWLVEFERNFFGSGSTYIETSLLAELERQVRFDEPIRRIFPEWDTVKDEFRPEGEPDLKLTKKEYVGGALWVWKEPEPNHEYMLCADVSEGRAEGGDFSAFHVLDINSCEQVAEFYSNSVPPHLFAQAIAQIGLYYNTALVIVENMGPGLSVTSRLQHDLYYDNLHYDKEDTPGVRVGPQNRPVILEALQYGLASKTLKIHSRRLIYELKTFLFNKTKKRAEAAKDKHDDLIMAMAIGLYVRNEKVRRVPVGIEKVKPELDITNNVEFEANLYERIKKAIMDDAPKDEFGGLDQHRLGLMIGLPLDPATVKEKDLHPDMVFKWTRPAGGIIKEFGW